MVKKERMIPGGGVAAGRRRKCDEFKAMMKKLWMAGVVGMGLWAGGCIRVHRGVCL